MNYLEVCVSLDREDADSAAGLLLAAGFAGMVMEEERFTDDAEGPISEPGLAIEFAGRPVAQSVEMRVYIAEIEGPERILVVREALEGLSFALTTRTLVEEDWAESWKQYWDVQHIGTRLVVKPSWKSYEVRAGEVVIELDPKQAFGTGTHPTTRLCLAELERLVQPSDLVCDVGTGSGILAIAALLLGARQATGVDSDPVAIAAAHENAGRNGVEGRCSFMVGSAGTVPDRADIVVANILAEIIVELACDLARIAARDLVVSGIIARKADLTRAALEAHGLVLVNQTQDGDWICQHFGRP